MRVNFSLSNQYQKPIRHGDVDILPLLNGDVIPKDAKIQKDGLVMHGENGHSHTILNGQVLIFEDHKYIKAEKDTYLIHEEHNKTLIPQGIYEVKQEVEFDPFTSTLLRVRD